MEVYLDNSATTRVLDEVMDEVRYMSVECYGNPSSVHRMGLNTEKKIQEARKSAASVINARPEEIFFTGGGTESNNIAIFGILNGAGENKNVVTTQIEHPSVYNVFTHLKDKFEVRYVNLDSLGKANVESLTEMVDENTAMVCIMHVNNELGIIQDIEEIGSIVKNKNRNAKFHVDAVQSYGKIKIDTKKIKADTIAFSSHKIHGPKGVGGLYIRSGLKISPTTIGGGQERNIRPGTENTPGIAGFGKACEIVEKNFHEEAKRLKELKNIYAQRIAEEIEHVKINSPLDDDGAQHILSVSFKNVRGEVLVHYLEMKGIYVSTGSACSSKSKSSRILDAIGLQEEYVDGTIRISLGHFNHLGEVDYVIQNLKDSVTDIRKIMKL
ncbi:MAG: cysteine desulfurase family protein [Sedimentibacter sp.]|uniref:cysteine desulfurase family protein n=1 Tax=Sedimentibacter sp. TaxID=1960295 RepID=UPI0031592BF0